MVLVLGALAVAVALNSGKKIAVGRVQPTHQRQPLDAIDHSQWNRLLQEYVDEQGLVDYARWQSNAADLRALDAYLAELSRGEPSERSRGEGRLAFWTNAYNALALRGILREYPVDRVPPRTARFWEYDLHRDLLLIVGDKRFSLDDIDRQLTLLEEPLVFLAVDATTRNGALLRNAAYLPEGVNLQLAENARRHFAQPNRLRVEPAQNEIWLGPAVQRHQARFGPSARTAAAAVAPYFPDDESRRLALNNAAAIDYLPADERLNDLLPNEEAQP